MTDITRILNQLEQGDSSSGDQLLPLVYEELRTLARQRLAHEKSGHSLNATMLVHEAYLRLVKCDRQGHWNGRGHFFGAAAEAMRRILVERARRKKAHKHGGQMQRVVLESFDVGDIDSSEELLALDEALTELERKWPEKAQLVKLRYFAGLTIPEAAKAMNISTSTANRNWRFARAWLHTELESGS